MLLVDNFRVLMLIGLICASGIGPSQADPKCVHRNGTMNIIKDCANEIGKNCGIYRPGLHEMIMGHVGCFQDFECSRPISGKMSCEGTFEVCCCLSAGPDPCNDLGNDEILKEVCAIDQLKKLKECKNIGSGGGSRAGDMPTSLTISSGILLMMMSLGAF